MLQARHLIALLYITTSTIQKLSASNYSDAESTTSFWSCDGTLPRTSLGPRYVEKSDINGVGPCEYASYNTEVWTAVVKRSLYLKLFTIDTNSTPDRAGCTVSFVNTNSDVYNALVTEVLCIRYRVISRPFYISTIKTTRTLMPHNN